MADSAALLGSYRDPTGLAFRGDGRLLRQVNHGSRIGYDRPLGSGPSDELVDAGPMVSHRDVEKESPGPGLAYRSLAPETVPFLTYPYEWDSDSLVFTLVPVRRLAPMARFPPSRVTEFPRRAGRRLVIELVPKTDSRIVREVILPSSTREGFTEHFDVERAEPIRGGGRIPYFMRSRSR